ncbi:MAG: hypothetical protein LBI61_02600 [Puniceicoccales bacterium]|nr:hypothetical protein [Puniceicoccales bacterium]
MTAKFEGEHIFRGRREINKAFVPKLRVSYSCLDDCRVYAGADAALALALPADDSFFLDNVSPYVGVAYDVTDIFTLDAGYIHYFYTKVPSGAANLGIKRNSDEIYGGVVADVILTPSAYVFYNFGRREVAIEGRVGYTFDLSDNLLSGLAVDLGGKIGYDRANKPFGMAYIDGYGKKDYFYYGASADLVYGINDNAKASIGVEVSSNSAKKNAWVNGYGSAGNKTKIWLNAAVECSF